LRVLLVPDNSSSQKAIDCLLGWSRSGLLGPFAWCSAGVGEVPAVDTLVSRVEAGESRELLLGAALQDSDSSKDELLAFYPATPEEGLDPGFAAAAMAYVDLLARTIAHDATRPARCTMVIAPSQIGQSVPLGLLSQGFAANVYVAPEDRAEPRDPNRLLGNESVFPLHSAHAIATVGDLWNEPDAGRPSVVDVLAKRQPHHQLAIQVIRCFSRGIDFGYLPDHVSAGVFQGDGGWPNPDPEHLDRIDDAESVVPHVVNDYMTTFRQELGLSDFQPRRLDDPEPLGLLEAFRLLVNLIVQRIRRKPFEMVRQRLDSIHDAAADWVEKQAGPNSGIQVKRRGRRAGGTKDAVELDAILERPLVVPDGPVAEAWTALRRLVLGLVDGSELPEGIGLTRLVNGRGQRALITDPAALAPDPDADPPPVAHPGGPICDPLRLDPALAVRDGTPSEALAEWSQQHSSALLWKVGLRIGTALETAKAEAQTSVDPEPEEGEEEEGQAREATGPEQRRSLRKRLRRTVILSSVLALLGVVVAAGQLSVIGIGIALLAIAGLWFLSLASAARRWLLADEEISRREDEEKLAGLNAALKRALRMGDEIRLERRYREYLDWAEILALLVHRPWVGDPLDRVALSPPIDHATLPAAFSVGVAEVSELGLERLSAAAGSGVFGTGWLAGLYETTERLGMTEIGIRRGLATEDAEVGRPDPTNDVGRDQEGPRRRLLDAIQRGKHRSLAGSKLGDEVLRYLGTLGPDRICERVAVLPTADGATVGEEIDALPPPLAGFQPPASLAKLAAELAPAVVRIECEAGHRDFGGTGVIVGDERMVATAQEVVDNARSISILLPSGEKCAAEVVRIDSERKLALLSFEAEGEVPALAISDSTVVVQGDPVIGIGRPFTEQQEPTTNWGLVTASQRLVSAHGAPTVPMLQVAYHRAEGAAGAAVFNLDGELLGIHHSASLEETRGLRGHRTSNVIPVDEVRRAAESDAGASAVGGTRGRRRSPGQELTISPSDFIEEVTHVDPPPALLIHHWKDAQKKNETTETIPSLEDAVAGTDGFTSLVDDLAFFTPLRVLVHRVDLVAPSNVRDLASFPEMDADEQRPDEKIASEEF
jgi:S1-C subfamily serine protease